MKQSCGACGAHSTAGARFCGACGEPIPVDGVPSPRAPRAGPAAPSASPTGAPVDVVARQVDVSVLGHRLLRRSLVRGLLLTAVLAALLIGGVIGFASGEARTALVAGGLAASATVALFVLGFLGYLLVVGARQPYAYRMDERGIEMLNASRAAQRTHRAALILGFLAGRPGAAAAGVAGMASERTHCAWEDVRRVDDYPADRAIFLRGGPLTKVYVFCTPENHARVRAFVLAHARQPGGSP